MPCPKRFAAALQETETLQDGTRMYTWRAVRRQQLQKLRKQTRLIVLFMALIEIMRVGVIDLVYQGKHGTKAPGPEDYGISHTVGYILAWLWTCAFAIVWMPLFSWWVPLFLDNPKTDNSGTKPEPSKTTVVLEKLAEFLTKLNLVLLPTCVALNLIQHIYHVVYTFIHVGPRPVNPQDVRPALNTRKAWGVRALLFSGVCASLAVGKAMFITLELTDLARVKPLEYFVIVLPIQINLGIIWGSALQFAAEKRQARKLAEKKTDSELAVTEKERLLAKN